MGSTDGTEPAGRAATGGSRVGTVRLEADWYDGTVVVHLAGRLDIPQAAMVRAVLRKAAGEPVGLVVCDLAGLTWLRPACAAVFVAAAPTVAWPAPALWLATATGQPAEVIDRALTRVATIGIASTVAEAGRRARTEPVWPRVVQLLPAHPSSARRARRLVVEACAAWDAPHLVDPVRLVVSELVTNAILHGPAGLELRLERRADRLRVAVRDDIHDPADHHGPSAGQVVADGVAELEDDPYRLLLVQAVAAVGVSYHPGGGKVTWASIPAPAAPPRPPEPR
jgi:hypothetical protein